MWSFDAQREQCCLGLQCELRCCPQLTKYCRLVCLAAEISGVRPCLKAENTK
nr:MAG TPA: hypothetical protein [Caudoviricetes sp.]DAV12479.1 MAG TPA: hypothetical protein [Caudoviricetes sp.]